MLGLGYYLIPKAIFHLLKGTITAVLGSAPRSSLLGAASPSWPRKVRPETLNPNCGPGFFWGLGVGVNKLLAWFKV